MSDQFEMKEIAKDWYFNNSNATLRDISDEFGIAYDTIRDWSDRDGWKARRDALANINMTNAVKGQADSIRDVIYNKIVNTEMAAKDLSELVKAWKSMAAITAHNQETTEYIDRDELTELIHEAD